jgi:hypothetical protein
MTPTPQSQYSEEPALYVFQIVLTPLQALRAQKIPIDLDSDFILTGINGTSTGLYTVNVLLPSGRMLSNVPLRSDNLIGTANQPTALPVTPIYKMASIGPALDLTDTSNANNTLEIVFSGIRRYRSM